MWVIAATCCSRQHCSFSSTSLQRRWPPIPGPQSQGLEGQEFPVAMEDLYEDYRYEGSSPTRWCLRRCDGQDCQDDPMLMTDYVSVG